ncbi:MAG TPA: serine/threonine-protein kinase, partial [Prosthecobacter sp.]|nr:serine/threonine-protein kinase [Prosthecobacter sp.]
MEGRFQILSTLASGGRGTLYRAWDKTRNCDVALKRPRAEAGARAEIERESRRLYALRHPGIARVLDYGEDAEGPFLVLELIQGETLEARLGKGRLGLADFRALVERTLEGIGAAHEAGLLHLDLKAENIMLPWVRGAAPQAVLVDFGLSREPGPAGAEAAGSVHGMAPEQFSGGEVDARTDLYALGVVYYQALTGRLPFQGETKPQVITAHLRHAMTPLQELRPDLSPELCAWVEGLLSVNPDERPASAEAALRAFQSIPLEERALDAGVVAEPVLPVLEDEEAEAAPVLTEEAEEAAAPVLMAAEPEAVAEP